MEHLAALLKALATLLWAGLAFYVFWSLKATIVKVLESRSINIKIAGNEINLPQATATIGAAVADIQAKLASLSGDHLRQADVPGQAVAETRDAATEPRPAGADGSERRVARILWVDDDPSNNAFLIDRLRGDGHRIDTSLTTADALQRLGQQQYDGVISDLGRKEGGVENLMAGRDLVKAMRESQFRQPFLVFSTFRAVQIKGELIAAGATEVTSSGIDVIRFVDACARARKG